MNTNTDPVRALIAEWRESAADTKRYSASDYADGYAAAESNCANRLEAALALAPPGAGEVPPEDRFEQFAQAEIARSPDALRELGAYLADVLDEDRFPRANRLLLQLAIEYAPPSAPVDIQPMQRGGGDPANPRDDSDRYCDHCPAGELASTPPSAPDDVNRLVRELDVALNGPEGAAPQASLCDLVSQVQRIVRERGTPLLAPSAPSGEAVAYRWRDRGTMQMVYSSTNPGYCNVEHLYTAPQQPAAVDRARFRKAPCYLCGYNGAGYFQSETHPCAALYHAAQQQGGAK